MQEKTFTGDNQFFSMVCVKHVWWNQKIAFQFIFGVPNSETSYNHGGLNILCPMSCRSVLSDIIHILSHSQETVRTNTISSYLTPWKVQWVPTRKHLSQLWIIDYESWRAPNWENFNLSRPKKKGRPKKRSLDLVDWSPVICGFSPKLVFLPITIDSAWPLLPWTCTR